jgi:hypothetical protein
VIAQEAVLRRQIEDLRVLVARAERGELLPPGKVMVAVDEGLVKELAQLGLPREEVVAGRFRVRLDTVDVRFRDRHGSVRLDGRVSPADRPADEVFAEVAVFGLLETVEVDEATGVLRGRVSPIGFEVKKVGLFGESDLGRRMLEELGRERLDQLTTNALDLTLPVRLERDIALGGLTAGPVRLRPGQVPLQVTVADVAAHGQKLWIALDVAPGAWKKLAAGGAS